MWNFLQVENLLDDEDFRTKVTREEFENLGQDLFDRIEKVIKDALASSEMTMVQLTYSYKDKTGSTTSNHFSDCCCVQFASVTHGESFLMLQVCRRFIIVSYILLTHCMLTSRFSNLLGFNLASPMDYHHLITIHLKWLLIDTIQLPKFRIALDQTAEHWWCQAIVSEGLKVPTQYLLWVRLEPILSALQAKCFNQLATIPHHCSFDAFDSMITPTAL